jgi:hypothetical protein
MIQLRFGSFTMGHDTKHREGFLAEFIRSPPEGLGTTAT